MRVASEEAYHSFSQPNFTLRATPMTVITVAAILNMVKRCSGLGKGSIVMTSERAKRARAVASTRVV
jgi:hypothetical protein